MGDAQTTSLSATTDVGSVMMGAGGRSLTVGTGMMLLLSTDEGKELKPSQQGSVTEEWYSYSDIAGRGRVRRDWSAEL